MKTIAMISALVCSVSLTACGGGGDEVVGSGTAEGIWGGTSSSSLVTALVVTADGETWGIYGSETGVIPAQAGILYGTASSGNGHVNGTVTDLSFLNATVTSGPIAGTVNAKTALNLNIKSSTLKASYDTTYDVPASLIAASYSGSLIGTGGGRLDESVVVSLNVNGILSGSTSSPDCTISGQATPRDTSKNVLNFNAVFTGSGCMFANGAVFTGVAQAYGGDLLMIGLNGGKTSGWMFVGDNK